MLLCAEGIKSKPASMALFIKSFASTSVKATPTPTAISLLIEMPGVIDIAFTLLCASIRKSFPASTVARSSIKANVYVTELTGLP